MSVSSRKASGPDVALPSDRRCDGSRTALSNAQSSAQWCLTNLESSDKRLPPQAAESSGTSSHRPPEVSATASSAGVLVAHLGSGLRARRQRAYFYGARQMLIVTQRQATRVPSCVKADSA